MANKIQLKRSAVAAKVPTTTDLDLGEIGVNTYDGKVYIKKDSGTPSIVEVTGPGVAPGTTGNVLTSNGTIWTSSAPSGSSPALSYNGPMILEDDFTSGYWSGNLQASSAGVDTGMWGYRMNGSGQNYEIVGGTAGHPGIVRMYQGNSGGTPVTYASGYNVGTTGAIHSNDIDRIVCIMRATTTLGGVFGIGSNPGADWISSGSTPGAYIRVYNGVATPRCGTAPATGSTTTATTNNWYVWEIVNLGTSWEFRKNGTTFATFTTSLPNGVYPYFIANGNGQANVTGAEWDYFGIKTKTYTQRYT